MIKLKDLLEASKTGTTSSSEQLGGYKGFVKKVFRNGVLCGVLAPVLGAVVWCGGGVVLRVLGRL